MLVYAPRPFPVEPDSIKTSPIAATDFLHQELTVPPGRGTDAAIKAGYDPLIGHTGGMFVNTSANTVWLLFQNTDVPAPNKNLVIDKGIRINQNGSTFVIPDESFASIYFATSATSAVLLRAMYFVRSIN